jgi:hypothetical protein
MMKKPKSLLAFFAGVFFLTLMMGINYGDASVPQRPAARRDAKYQNKLKDPATLPRKTRTDLLRPRAAPSFLTWAYALQGDREDEARGVFPTADGGVIFWGDTRMVENRSTAWLTRLSASGEVDWSRVYGSPGTIFREVTQTADGGIVAAGDMSGGSSTDAIVMKISPAGATEWGAIFGSESGDSADSVQQTADGGYIAAGVTNAYVDTSSSDYWISKFTASGDVEWSYVLGGPGTEGDFVNGAANATVRQASDDGYFLVGSSDSFAGGGNDIWIVKLTSLGAIEWQKGYGGQGGEGFANSGPHFVTTADGGLVVACSTSSFGAPGSDGWVFKVSSAGDIEWQRRIGGPETDTLNTVQPTADGGYVVGGVTTSYPGDGFRHAWMVKFDALIAVQWQWSYGINSNFDIQGLHQGSDGSFVAGGCRTPTGHTSWYWDVYRDAFVMKTGADGVVGVLGNVFMAPSEAAEISTDAVPFDTPVNLRPGFETRSLFSIDFIAVSPVEELLTWGGIQPPIDLVLTRETDRGLFKGEGFNTLQWSPNPWNSQYEVVSFGIYRRPADDAVAPYQRIATVAANVLAYVDEHLGLAEKYAYVVTSIDAQGTESPVSQAIRN